MEGDRVDPECDHKDQRSWGMFVRSAHTVAVLLRWWVYPEAVRKSPGDFLIPGSHQMFYYIDCIDTVPRFGVSQ